MAKRQQTLNQKVAYHHGSVWTGRKRQFPGLARAQTSTAAATRLGRPNRQLWVPARESPPEYSSPQRKCPFGCRAAAQAKRQFAALITENSPGQKRLRLHTPGSISFWGLEPPTVPFLGHRRNSRVHPSLKFHSPVQWCPWEASPSMFFSCLIVPL